MMQLLMLADDADIDVSEEDLQPNIREFSEAVKRHRLAINTNQNDYNNGFQ